MAAPAFVQAGTGWVTTTGTGNGTLASTTAGNLIVVQMLADGGSLDGSISVAAGSNVENIAGTDNALTNNTTINGGAAVFSVGSATEASQKLYFGRSLGGTVTVTANVGGSGEDLYSIIYEFSGVSADTTLTNILENSSLGSAVNGTGTSTTVADTGVTTLGADRLAVNFVAVNDDNAVAAFAGMTGGTWAEATAEFLSATGTDGCIQLQTATMDSAGTINGGTLTMAASDAWGVVGFALIPAATSSSLYPGSVNRPTSTLYNL
jgi:hypothetical protein